MRDDRHRSNFRSTTYLPYLQVKASSAKKNCVTVKQDFADEEDYIKAGGSELLFVQMQQNKYMDKQSKLADKVSFLFYIQLLTSLRLYLIV